MGRARPRAKPSRAVRFVLNFFKWFFRGAALYAVIWLAMRYIGRPWLGMELLWSFLIVDGVVVAVGLWGDSTKDIE